MKEDWTYFEKWWLNMQLMHSFILQTFTKNTQLGERLYYSHTMAGTHRHQKLSQPKVRKWSLLLLKSDCWFFFFIIWILLIFQNVSHLYFHRQTPYLYFQTSLASCLSNCSEFILNFILIISIPKTLSPFHMLCKTSVCSVSSG